MSDPRGVTEDHRRLTSWIRLDVPILTDAKLRRARARGLWPILLLVLKQSGGVVPTADLDPELLAQDLDGLLDAQGVRERIEGLKREGLLVHGTYTVKIGRGEREVTGWTTPNWRSYQPDERSRRGGFVGPRATEPRAESAKAATRPRPPSPPEPVDAEATASAFRRAAVVDTAEFLSNPELFGAQWVSLGPDTRKGVLALWKRLPDTMATEGLARLQQEMGEATVCEALRRLTEDSWSNPKPGDVRRRCEEIKRTQKNAGAAGRPAAGRFQSANPIPMKFAGPPVALPPAGPPGARQ